MWKIARFGMVAACLVVSALSPVESQAQEFNCQVAVNYQQLQGNDYTFLRDLPMRIEEYLNDHAWTEDRFDEFERIDCQMDIVLEEALSLTSFKGRIIVAMRRPIYGTTVSTTVVQFNDSDLQFGYTQGQPLIHDLERYDPLTSVLDFYALVLLGYDYDTFSELGGTRYFEMARRIAERAQGLGVTGWSALGGDQGRSNLISQLLDPRFQRLREAYFAYHYGGLDHFVQEPQVSRGRVLEALASLQQLYDEVSRSYAIDTFFTAKYVELTGIFMDSQVESQAYAVLSQLDPSHMTEYNKLTQ